MKMHICKIMCFFIKIQLSNILNVHKNYAKKKAPKTKNKIALMNLSYLYINQKKTLSHQLLKTTIFGLPKNQLLIYLNVNQTMSATT